ncbi:glycoside hydrolase family 3 protein [Candidatus Dojkabacteria bacterium]|uniref:beta-N-acetylhexosaminidase n=1 Tax=Candidatus Dojkabacteria bacterium TaxID=2099670 RepID=A0A955L509_9BACT|nr:glycoside hydrolase family 3 protein [Candidatus Dojkabacteria bacterium]
MKAIKIASLIFTVLLFTILLIGYATFNFLRISDENNSLIAELRTCANDIEIDWNKLNIDGGIAQLEEECIHNADRNYKLVGMVKQEVENVDKGYIHDYLKLETNTQSSVIAKYNDSSYLLVSSNEVYDQLASDRATCQNELDFSECVCTNVQNLEDTIATFTLEQKLKLLLVPAFSKSEYDTLNKSKYGFGGYVLIDSLAYTESEQVKKQSDQLIANSAVPPFMALDAEGGVVQRFSWYNFKTLNSLKSLNDDEFCKEISMQAQALKESGFNMSLSPVVDMSPNADYWIYSRIIDTDPQVASDVASRYVSCMRDNGILTTGKHFPGHGSTKLDSHKVVPVSTLNKEQWASYDALPFQSLIANDIPFIMTGHLKFENINSEIATLSSYWMNDVLRGELGYQNLIITDDLMMLSPNSTTECAELIAKAINNGGDMALFVHNEKCNSPEVVKYIVDNKLITEEVVNNRLTNILRIKKEYLCQ